MEVQVIRSRRKTMEIQIKPDCTVVVRVPLRISKREIQRFVDEKQDWIVSTILKMQKRQETLKEAGQKKMSNDEIKALAEAAMDYIPGRVDYYADLIGVKYSRITIRNQKTRWGSCSSKGGLNFNCLLMKTPREVIDYVVIHELCHRLEMNHSKAFWALVEKQMPDYKVHRKWLKDNGPVLMNSMI